MNIFKKGFARLYQKVMFLVLNILKVKKPQILDNYEEVKKMINDNHYQNILFITSHSILKTKLFEQIKSDFNPILEIYPGDEPKVKYLEEIRYKYLTAKIDFVIAIGGGSVLDASKVLAAGLTNPNTKIKDFCGLLKVKKAPLPMLLIPTTAGTGSECTVAAVISDEETMRKASVSDLKLVPKYTMFDPTLLSTLPSELTSGPGMDALTHAVEAYIGHSNTKETRSWATNAVVDIFKYLEVSYNEPTNTEARLAMQKASYNAGLAFTRAYVGYVHAIAHALGVRFHLRHGYLCAIILPEVLEIYGDSVRKPLSILSKACGFVNEISSKKEQFAASQIFIQKVRELNSHLKINQIENVTITEDDFKEIFKHIQKEVYPSYPIPKYLDEQELRIIIKNIIKEGD